MPRLYSGLLGAITPLAFARLWWKGRANPAYRERWGERLGHIPDLPGGPRLWVHAVSVGEVMTAAPLLRAWQARHPDWAVLVTTTTPTGSAQLRRLFGESIEHAYLPFDLPGAVRRFLAHARPTLGVIMETELWPNLFAEAGTRGVPLILANARLSERSLRGYARVGGLASSTLRELCLIAARGPEDAARFIALGADPDRVEALGNLKFDLELPAGVSERGQAWRAMFGPERPVWIAASTHEGEDGQVLDAHRLVLERHPEALLLLAPRHPERAGEVSRLIESQAFGLVRRSGLSPSPLTPLPSRARGTIILIDTLGELLDFYAASDVAFVGGSLVPHGGHNPLEPAALGLPVLSGAHVQNFNEVYAAMRAAGAAQEVGDAEALGAAAAGLLADAGRRKQMGEAGRMFIGRHRGALGRLLEHMESLAAGAAPR